MSFLQSDPASKTISPGMGGTCLVNLVLARLARGLPTDVITLDPGATDHLARFDGGLLRLWIVKRRSHRAARDGYREEVRGIINALQESRPAVCHANWTYEYGLAAIHQRVAPSIVSVHDHAGRMLRYLGLPYAPLYLMSQRVIRKAGLVTAVAPHIADYIHRLSGKNAQVVPNVLPSWSFRAQKEKPNGPKEHKIIIPSTWAPFRNVRRALKAFALLLNQYPHAVLQLIGPGLEQDGPAHRWARARALDQRVVFLGKVRYASALELIAESSILLLPSLEEALPSPLIEAMTLSVPVVAAREAGGSSWLAGDGRGTLVQGRSTSSLTEGLLQVTKQLVERQPLIEAQIDLARNYIQHLCGADRVLDQLESIYHDATSAAT